MVYGATDKEQKHGKRVSFKALLVNTSSALKELVYGARVSFKALLLNLSREGYMRSM